MIILKQQYSNIEITIILITILIKTTTTTTMIVILTIKTTTIVAITKNNVNIDRIFLWRNDKWRVMDAERAFVTQGTETIGMTRPGMELVWKWYGNGTTDGIFFFLLSCIHTFSVSVWEWHWSLSIYLWLDIFLVPVESVLSASTRSPSSYHLPSL